MKSLWFDQALEDFNSMRVTNVKDLPGGKVGKLPDDRTVNVKSKSSDGRPTLEIYDGAKSQSKFVTQEGVRNDGKLGKMGASK